MRALATVRAAAAALTLFVTPVSANPNAVDMGFPPDETPDVLGQPLPPIFIPRSEEEWARLRQGSIDRAQAALAEKPKLHEFVHPPGSVNEEVAQEQAQCVAKAFGIEPFDINQHESPYITTVIQGHNRTEISVSGVGEGSVNIVTETDENTLVSRCSCGPDGEPEAFAFRRAGYSITFNGKSTSLNTYVSSDRPGRGISLLGQVSFGRAVNENISMSQKADPVEDGSLANSPQTLIRFGQEIISNNLGTGDTQASIEDIAVFRSATFRIIAVGKQCSIINFGAN